ncbi:YAP-binding/ALF4/Glomulin, partial [Trinorchestia longiramus]
IGLLLGSFLDKEEFEEAVVEIKKSQHLQVIVKFSMELIPLLSRRLHDSNCSAELRFCVEDLLVYIASKAKVKEVVMALLVELNVLKRGQDLLLILNPLRVAIMRNATHNSHVSIFRWTFKSVIDCISKMELPSNYNLEGKERFLLDCDPCVISLVDALRSVIKFFQPIVESTSKGHMSFADDNLDTREFLAKTLVHLFDKPLTFLDVYCERENNINSSYSLASNLISMIDLVLKNPVRLLVDVNLSAKSLGINKENGEDEDDYNFEDSFPEPLPLRSLGTLFYCYYHQHMSNSLPSVHCPRYIFRQCLPVLCALLSSPEHLAVHKGLLLAQSLIAQMDEQTLPASSLDFPCHYEFVRLLTVVLTMTDNKELRMCAFNVFRDYVMTFEYSGRYRLFEYLLHSLNHAGLLGFTITEIKQNIYHSLQKTSKEDSCDFVGSSMWKLVYEACKLPDGETTDMLDFSDKILAILNLLTFLFIQETPEKSREFIQTLAMPAELTFSSSEMPKHLQHIEEEFLGPLSKGLQLSREHYELKVKLLESGADPGDDGPDVDLYAGGSLMPGFTDEQKIEVMRLSLSRFDMINCVLAQVTNAADQL